MILSDNERQTMAYYDQHGDEWASKRKKASEPSFWHDEYLAFQLLQRSQGKALEIGSGAGREALELTAMGYEYTGVDLSEELLKIAQKANPSSSFFYAPPYRLPFPSQSFDAVFSWALLPHAPKARIGEALKEAKRVLKSGALAFFAMREGEGESSEAGTGRWFSYYKQDEFKQMLETQGFIIQKMGIKPSRADLVWLTFFVRNSSNP
jgi:SAM-dependent methyltransferase